MKPMGPGRRTGRSDQADELREGQVTHKLVGWGKELEFGVTCKNILVNIL